MISLNNFLPGGSMASIDGSKLETLDVECMTADFKELPIDCLSADGDVAKYSEAVQAMQTVNAYCAEQGLEAPSMEGISGTATKVWDKLKKLLMRAIKAGIKFFKSRYSAQGKLIRNIDKTLELVDKLAGSRESEHVNFPTAHELLFQGHTATRQDDDMFRRTATHMADSLVRLQDAVEVISTSHILDLKLLVEKKEGPMPILDAVIRTQQFLSAPLRMSFGITPENAVNFISPSDEARMERTTASEWMHGGLAITAIIPPLGLEERYKWGMYTSEGRSDDTIVKSLSVDQIRYKVAFCRDLMKVVSRLGGINEGIGIALERYLSGITALATDLRANNGDLEVINILESGGSSIAEMINVGRKIPVELTLQSERIANASLQYALASAKNIK